MPEVAKAGAAKAGVAKARLQAEIDRRFMASALRLAERGLGSTAPNPSVGAVIVDPASGEVLARGWTQPGGRPHAETVALDQAGARARGATLYVTLEPCSHHGRTPPCASAITAAGIKRIVAGHADPDIRVCGRGFALLQQAGIEVVRDVLVDEARWLHAGHILRVTADRPFVQLKLATAADGLMTPGNGQPVWDTSPEARARGHLLRARADAIMVGRGTVEVDNPELTCRLPGLEARSPVRVVLDGRLHMPLDAQLSRSARQVPVWVVAAPGAPAAQQKALEAAGVSVVEAQRSLGARLEPRSVLGALAHRGITRVLIEGGPMVASSFLEAGLVDEVLVFRAGKALPRQQAQAPGAGRRLKPLGDRGLEVLEDRSQWSLCDERSCGADTMTVYRYRCGPLMPVACTGVTGTSVTGTSVAE